MFKRLGQNRKLIFGIGITTDKGRKLAFVFSDYDLIDELGAPVSELEGKVIRVNLKYTKKIRSAAVLRELRGSKRKYFYLYASLDALEN